ncbi:MlaC/ttg2D family ABC transporter substrate-binding protein [Parahaliea mediterranea]|uniref:ABC transporter substrate-binding protein n=1 Tax=Parahaliea mediterranea TaxID=651086 RepID=A0A939DC50_9GAMM|nr:ABC transporter substrate-binding protein [Parahaliea mediterranea]MBN7795349.1 ABC transporter substrate-binding protein [Parahaliea mediterranea]
MRWIAILAAMAVSAAAAVAQEGPDQRSAHEVVSDTTRDVMELVAEVRENGGDTGSEYYAGLESVLDPVVDFRGFARGVMGPYASSSRYRSLDQAGREALVGQLDRFTEKMREVMVRTYGKGLLAFGGSRIDLTEPSGDEADERRTSVQQLIYKEGAEPYVVLYQMGRDKEGSWKLRNMIIENVNLGEIYRSQFASAARKYDGDLDKVIDNWSAVDIDA